MKRLIIPLIATLVLAAFAPDQQNGESQPPTKRRVTIALSDYIFIQLDENGCWKRAPDPLAGDQRVTFRVIFTPEGKFAHSPQIVSPSDLAGAKESIRELAAEARSALEACNAKGFDIPIQFHGIKSALDIELTFPDVTRFKRS